MVKDWEGLTLQFFPQQTACRNSNTVASGNGILLSFLY